jgi:hypothetical protein
MLSELDDLLSEIEGEMSEKPQQAAPAGTNSNIFLIISNFV